MPHIVLFAVVALTSVAAYFLLGRRLGLAADALRPALEKVLESLGTALLFSAVNLALGLGLVLGTRHLTGTFVSAYLLDDVTWLVLSFLQALVFQWWREVGRRPGSGQTVPGPVATGPCEGP